MIVYDQEEQSRHCPVLKMDPLMHGACLPLVGHGLVGVGRPGGEEYN